MSIDRPFRSPLLLTVTALVGAALPAQQDPPGDARVTEAIEDELLFDVAVPSQLVDVAVDDGIVTLTGTTENLLASQRAASIASTTRGVRAVVNRIQVVPDGAQSLAALRESVEAALRSDPATDAYEVRAVVVPGGEVTLEGRAQSWAERQLCEKVAAGVDGVTAVKNAIELDYATKRPDDEIAKDVQGCLRWDVLVDDGLIDVACHDGVVTLSGIVGSAAERIRACQAAWVAGVEGVESDDLQVAKWARDDMLRGSKYVVRSNEQVRDAIHDALQRDPRVAGAEIDVTVENGRVTLRGEVDNLKARRIAAADARNTVGVSQVLNRLRVEPLVPRSAAAIEAAVRDALHREPYVDVADVGVHVSNGVVRLSGRVDTNFERACADDAVARVPGVVDVDNLLAVRDPSMVAFDPYVDLMPLHAFRWFHYGPTTTFESDAEIRRRIEAELWWSPFVTSADIDVAVDGGVATLTGEVTGRAEHLAALENAFEGGAVWVVDDLTNGVTEAASDQGSQ